MKCLLSFFSFLIVCQIIAQPIPSKVFNWDQTAEVKVKNGTSTKIFTGSAAILKSHVISGIELQKGKKFTFQDKTNEAFFIIKNGPVLVTLNGIETMLYRGSVISVLPGDKMIIDNKNETPVSFYEMLAQSILPPDTERGSKAGGSFLINWKDVAFKPHDKGGVRQFFDRQTVMMNRFDIHVTQLNVGFNSHAPHTHKNEEIILMLDGNAEMQIGTDHQKANPGDVVFLNSMVLHNLTNVGTVPCLYFAIQWN